jgi:hypothetical protein
VRKQVACDRNYKTFQMIRRHDSIGLTVSSTASMKEKFSFEREVPNPSIEAPHSLEKLLAELEDAETSRTEWQAIVEEIAGWFQEGDLTPDQWAAYAKRIAECHELYLEADAIVKLLKKQIQEKSKGHSAKN